ncbi:MAG: hypothetical protein ACKOQ3_04400 [Novosphingobium sp.]
MDDTGAETPSMTAGQGELLRRSALAAAGFVFVCLIGAMLVPARCCMPLQTSLLVFGQDLWLVVALFAVTIGILLAPDRTVRLWQPGPRGIAAIALGIVVLAYVGRRLVLEDVDLVRDEQMVGFDAWIYAHGRLAWPLPQFWRDHVDALGSTFLYPEVHPVAWVSTYLPGNALLHAAVGHFADPGLTNPLLAGGSAALLWSCAGKIWPAEREVRSVVLLVLVLSGQFLFAAMTTWAMTAHLFFNLLWLRLFLADRRGTDAAALVVGFYATGLHQLLFHPLFVAPFLLLLLTQGRWMRLVPYAAAYAAIGLFWLNWPHLIQPLIAGPAGASGLTAPAAGFADRLLGALAGNTDTLPLTAANLLRFVTWNHLALLPLMFAAWPAVRRGGLPMALALGIALPIVIVAVILPWQGYGFGYRYLHPVLGNAALLAGYGWCAVAELGQRLRQALVVASAGAALLVLPLQTVMAHQVVIASAQADRTIQASGADYALINTRDGFGYGNIVYNRPNLSNRPIRLFADQVPDHARLAARICRPGVTVAMPVNSFFRAGTRNSRVTPFETADATLAKLRRPYEAAGCRIALLR